MPLIIPSNSISDGGYEVDNSLRFNDGSSDYLTRTPSGTGNRKTWTLVLGLKEVIWCWNQIFRVMEVNTDIFLNVNILENIYWFIIVSYIYK